MALSIENVLHRGIVLGDQTRAGKDNAAKPQRFKESQINRFMSVPPEELSPEHPVITPVGTWYQDGVEAFFTQIPQEKIDAMTIPSIKTVWERTKKAAIKYGRIT